VFTDHHSHFGHRVLVASPRAPEHAKFLRRRPVDIFAIQVGFAAILVPPAALQVPGAVRLALIVVLVLGTEARPDLTRQRVTFEHHANTRKLISQTAELPRHFIIIIIIIIYSPKMLVQKNS